MNDYTPNFSQDLGTMSEQDMFALSEVLNMIEPGAGQESNAHWLDTLIQSIPFYEVSVIALIALLGAYTLRQVFTKTSFGQLIRLKLTL